MLDDGILPRMLTNLSVKLSLVGKFNIYRLPSTITVLKFMTVSNCSNNVLKEGARLQLAVCSG